MKSSHILSHSLCDKLIPSFFSLIKLPFLFFFFFSFLDDKNPCHLPEAPGPCRGLVTRYFFDSRSQQCRNFYYGGCFGNANNFRSMAECQAKCQNPGRPGRPFSPRCEHSGRDCFEQPGVLHRWPCLGTKLFYNCASLYSLLGFKLLHFPGKMTRVNNSMYNWIILSTDVCL